MAKVLALGIDSLDPRLLVRFCDDLPHFTELRKKSPVVRLKSVFPVDSIPAWVSIYTGLNPARHGILKSFDIFESSWKDILNIDTGVFKRHTFWDEASDNGKKVCIVLPFLAYPPWAVNGLMVSRSTDEFPVPTGPSWTVAKKVEAFPAEAKGRYGIPDTIIGTKGRPPSKKDFIRYVEVLKNTVVEEGRLALRLSKAVDWDLFFAMFSWLDIVQHFFWRFHDEEDPTYPGDTPYKHVIRDFYELHDAIVGDFINCYPDTTTIVFSDHGHAMRPTRTVNINETLRKTGLLVASSGGTSLIPHALERVKRRALDAVRKYELDHAMLKLAKMKGLSTISKDIYMSSGSIDLERSTAYLSSFAGPKSYGHGGIEVRKEHLTDSAYEAIRTLIVNELSVLEEPNMGTKLVKWACRREDLYEGEHVDLYPDVVFELAEGYGVYWGINTPLLGTAYEHNLASGGHHKDAVLLVANTNDAVKTRNAQLVDIRPTILHLLGVEHGLKGDGTSIF